MRRPLLFPVIFFLAGIIVCGVFDDFCTIDMLSIFTYALLGLIILLIALRKTRTFFYVICFIFFFVLGFSRHLSAMAPQANDIGAYIGEETCQELVIFGTVTGYPESKSTRYVSYNTFPFQVRRVLTENGEYGTSGLVLVKLYSLLKKPLAGDELIIAGKLVRPDDETNLSGFSYRAYLKGKGIDAIFTSKEQDLYVKTGESKNLLAIIRRFLFKLRKNSDRIVRAHLNGTARNVIESVVLGLRSGMPREEKDVFKKTGTMHILAVSGLHVGVVGGAFLGMLYFLRCPRKTSYWLTMIIILSFAVFAGGRASSMRAAIMGTLLLISRVMERNHDPLNALFLSAFLAVFVYPMQVLQAGFILSYIAVLSILYVTPLSDSFLSVPKRKHKESKMYRAKRIILNSLSVSLAVWIGMLPITARYFNIITPSMVLANLLAIPVLFMLVTLGAVLIFTGLFAILSPITECVGFLIKAITTIFFNIMRTLSHVPFSSIEVPTPGNVFLVVYYAVLISVVLLFRKIPKRI